MFPRFSFSLGTHQDGAVMKSSKLTDGNDNIHQTSNAIATCATTVIPVETKVVIPILFHCAIESLNSLTEVKYPLPNAHDAPQKPQMIAQTKPKIGMSVK